MPPRISSKRARYETEEPEADIPRIRRRKRSDRQPTVLDFGEDEDYTGGGSSRAKRNSKSSDLPNGRRSTLRARTPVPAELFYGKTATRSRTTQSERVPIPPPAPSHPLSSLRTQRRRVQSPTPPINPPQLRLFARLPSRPAQPNPTPPHRAAVCSRPVQLAFVEIPLARPRAPAQPPRPSARSTAPAQPADAAPPLELGAAEIAAIRAKAKAKVDRQWHPKLRGLQQSAADVAIMQAEKTRRIVGLLKEKAEKIFIKEFSREAKAEATRREALLDALRRERRELRVQEKALRAQIAALDSGDDDEEEARSGNAHGQGGSASMDDDGDDSSSSDGDEEDDSDSEEDEDEDELVSDEDEDEEKRQVGREKPRVEDAEQSGGMVVEEEEQSVGMQVEEAEPADKAVEEVDELDSDGESDRDWHEIVSSTIHRHWPAATPLRSIRD